MTDVLPLAFHRQSRIIAVMTKSAFPDKALVKTHDCPTQSFSQEIKQCAFARRMHWQAIQTSAEFRLHAEASNNHCVQGLLLILACFLMQTWHLFCTACCNLCTYRRSELLLQKSED